MYTEFLTTGSSCSDG